MTAAVKELAPTVGIVPLCRALGVSRSSIYRSIKKVDGPPVVSRRPKPDRALTEDERQVVLDVLHEKRFVDLPPAQVFATLLDEGNYLCSIRTMYRIDMAH
jgi:putative transposase